MTKEYYYKLYDKTCNVSEHDHYAYICVNCGANLIAEIQDFKTKYKIAALENVGLQIFDNQKEWAKDALWCEKI